MSEKVVGVIGGSGLYEMEGLEEIQTISLKTPFGNPSDAFIVGRLEGMKVAFLPRHGKGHRVQPSSLNFRANIYGMKKLGVQWIIGVSAVGSMKESIHPGDMVIPNQFIDQTKGRPSTFFNDGIVGHVSFADPVCPILSRIVQLQPTRRGHRFSQKSPRGRGTRFGDRSRRGARERHYRGELGSAAPTAPGTPPSPR